MGDCHMHLIEKITNFGAYTEQEGENAIICLMEGLQNIKSYPVAILKHYAIMQSFEGTDSQEFSDFDMCMSTCEQFSIHVMLHRINPAKHKILTKFEAKLRVLLRT